MLSILEASLNLGKSHTHVPERDDCDKRKRIKKVCILLFLSHKQNRL